MCQWSTLRLCQVEWGFFNMEEFMHAVLLGIRYTILTKEIITLELYFRLFALTANSSSEPGCARRILSKQTTPIEISLTR